VHRRGGPFYRVKHWDRRDGSAIAASAGSRHVSSVCTCKHKRHSERLLRWPRVEATHAWHCPLAAGGGEVDGAEVSHATQQGVPVHLVYTATCARGQR
jgi:hypothetical protein